MSPELIRRIGELFPANAEAVAARLEAECGEDLPLIGKQGAQGLERVRCAVLKLSEGKLDKLEYAIGRAKRDWRDVLVWSGFGNDATLHRAWLREPLA